MKKRWDVGGLLGLLVLGAGLLPAFAGDSLYGRVTAVKSAEVVVFEYTTAGTTAGAPTRSTVRPAGRYDVRLIGVDVPESAAMDRQARQLVSSLVLGKNARMRFEY